MKNVDIGNFESTFENEDNQMDIVWRNVRNRRKPFSNKLLIEKQDEESRKYDNFRKSDLSAYLSLINEICSIKTSNSSIGVKIRCYIPKDFFDKKIECKINDKDDDRRTSLAVRLPQKTDDFISKQAKYRRSLAFKKLLNSDEIDNILKIPLIEEDAADLCDLIGMATNKPLFNKKSLTQPQRTESCKLPYLLELNDKPKAGILVSCYVKDHILKLPLLMPNADRLRELYTNCIIKDEHLNNLYTKRRDMLPKDLLDYIADFGSNNETDNNPKIIKDEIADRDQFFHTSINVYASDILHEIEIESLEFSVFIKPCYILHFSQVIPDILLLNLQDPLEIEKALKQTIDLLKADIMNPISKSRKRMMEALMAGNTNPSVARVFIDHLASWLEGITTGLFSLHNPIREESCYCVGFLFTQTKLLYDLLNFYSSEFVYEIVSIIFKAIDHYPLSFELFYSLIGYIMDGCPLVSILQCVCDKGPVSKNYLMQKRWPKFIVFACKHWPNETFKNGQYALKKIQDLLEKSFLSPVTYKTSKMALAFMGRRFDRKALTCTHWVLSKCGPLDDE